MKKLLLVSALVAFCLNVQGQEMTAERQNDIMISPIEVIAGPALNISYERLLNENSGVGINVVYLLDNAGDDSGLQSQISPYYRMYFGAKYASGFFVEGFVPITSSNDGTYDYSAGPGYYQSYFTPQKNTTVGIGVGFGGKWVARKNIIFEASIGIARRFGMDSTYDSAITGKGMLGIGYRF